MEAVTECRDKVALITGAAHRIGAGIARHLHAAGYRVLLHYYRSGQQACALAAELNELQPDSACCLQADILQAEQIGALASAARQCWGRVDVLVNNASQFYPTPLPDMQTEDWHRLMGSNALAPLLLCQHLQTSLQQTGGNIINLIDSTSKFGLADFIPYAMAKAALANMTRSMARELAPEVRVNGIAPGIILWPEYAGGISDEEKTARLAATALGRTGSPDDIAHAVLFLLRASYITGAVIRVDGGAALYAQERISTP